MSESETDKARRINNFWQDCVKYNKELHDRAKKNRGFYLGPGQWTDEDIAKLKKQKRLPVTINKIFRQVNMLSGVQRQNRYDMRVFPRKGGNKAVADVYTEVSKHAIDNDRGDFKCSYALFLGLVEIQSFIGLEIDYTHDLLNGDIRIIVPSSKYMAVDPNCQTYDMNEKDGAKYLFRGYYWTKEEMILNYPKKEDDINKMGMVTDKETDDSGLWDEMKEATYDKDLDYNTNDVISHHSKDSQYLIKDCWWKSNERYDVFFGKREWAGMVRVFNNNNGDNKKLYKLAQKAVEKQPELFAMKPIIVPLLHKTVKCGNVILEDIEDPRHGINRFPYHRFIPYYIDGESLAHVDNLISPQQELDKRRTQALGHLDSQHVSGLLVKKGTMTVEQKRDYKKNASTPGFIAEYDKEPAPIPVRPPSLSVGHVQLAELSSKDMDEIGVNPGLLGTESKRAESGRAIALLQTAGMVTHEILYDNWKSTFQSFAEDLVEMIMNVHSDGTSIYTDDEIKYIVEQGNLVDKESFTKAMKDIVRENPMIDINTMSEGQKKEMEEHIDKAAELIFMRKLRNPTILKYGVRVDRGSSSPTIRMANFHELLEIVKLFPWIPPDILLEYSDIAGKEKIIERIKEMQSRQQMQPEGKA